VTEEEEFVPGNAGIVDYVLFVDKVAGRWRAKELNLDYAKPRRLTIEKILAGEAPLNDQVGALYINRSLENPEPVEQEGASTRLSERAIAHRFEPSRMI
jgi:hypothetical protein